MTETSEIRVEQTKLDELYARLDELREETTARLGTVRISEVGGNHQHRTERDAFATLYEDQLIRLDGAEEGLCFGRLDIVDEDAPAYIGRIGLTDEQRQQILIDWRAPAAERLPSTAANPDGIARRRHLVTANRKVTGIEDDCSTSTHSMTHSGRTCRAKAPARGADHSSHRSDGRYRRDHQAEQDAIIRRRSPASSSSRADRAPARPPSPSTAPPSCSTVTGSASRNPVSSSSARRRCSSSTSRRSCPASARPGPSCSPRVGCTRDSTRTPRIHRRSPRSRAVPSWLVC